MEKIEALKIINMISDGLDPYEENRLNDRLPEQNPVTLRALCSAVMSLLSPSDKETLKSCYASRKSTRYIDSVSGPLKFYLEEKEAKEIRDALFAANFSEREAAALLGYDMAQLESKIKNYGFGNLGIVAKYFLSAKQKGVSIDAYLKRLEKQLILEALEATHHKKMQAADLLGITFRSFRHRVDKLGIEDTERPNNSQVLERMGEISLEQFLKSVERDIITHALNMADGNKTVCAAILGITFRSFRHRYGQLEPSAE